jgi:predicted nucleic acid-binding Zn ribbon protein
MTLWLGKRRWLRCITVAYLVLDMILGAAFGLNNVARFGLREDIPRDQLLCLEAYRSGLSSAQEVANRYIPMMLVLALCLAVLAWMPTRKQDDHIEGSQGHPERP